MMKAYLVFFILLLSAHATAVPATPQPKVLFLTFNEGQLENFKPMAKALSLDLTGWLVHTLPSKFFDGATEGNALFDISHERADHIWNLHKDYFEIFDCIIVTDTTPLARIFLQNDWKKPLIIWMHNRFDYYDKQSLDCNFPDREYYDLIQAALHKKNVKIIASNAFEHVYAQFKGINTGSLIIPPAGVPYHHLSLIPENILKEETFFIPPRHNETLFMNLSQILTQLGINSYCGSYNGPHDLKDFKGIIHIPYAWSTVSLFENLSLGIPYFIPSLTFIRELMSKPGFYFQDLPFFTTHNLGHLAEWYNPERSEIFIYFDSWEDLKYKIQHTDFPALREKIKLYAKRYANQILDQWQNVFNSLTPQLESGSSSNASSH
jgi:hypothetical protein